MMNLNKDEWESSQIMKDMITQCYTRTKSCNMYWAINPTTNLEDKD